MVRGTPSIWGGGPWPPQVATCKPVTVTVVGGRGLSVRPGAMEPGEAVEGGTGTGPAGLRGWTPGPGLTAANLLVGVRGPSSRALPAHQALQTGRVLTLGLEGSLRANHVSVAHRASCVTPTEQQREAGPRPRKNVLARSDPLQTASPILEKGVLLLHKRDALAGAPGLLPCPRNLRESRRTASPEARGS